MLRATWGPRRAISQQGNIILIVFKKKKKKRSMPFVFIVKDYVFLYNEVYLPCKKFKNFSTLVFKKFFVKEKPMNKFFTLFNPT